MSNNRNSMSVGSKRTGVRYALGKEDAEYLADVLEISVMDAKAILGELDGANGYQVLRVVMKSRANVLKSNKRAAYVRTIVRANAERIKAQNPDPKAHNTHQKLSTIPPAIPPALLPSKAPTVPPSAAARIAAKDGIVHAQTPSHTNTIPAAVNDNDVRARALAWLDPARMDIIRAESLAALELAFLAAASAIPASISAPAPAIDQATASVPAIDDLTAWMD